MRYVLIDRNTNVVVNAVEWDGGPQWIPPANTTAIPSETGSIGDTWDGSTFLPAPPPPVEETPMDMLLGMLEQKGVISKNDKDLIARKK